MSTIKTLTIMLMIGLVVSAQETMQTRLNTGTVSVDKAIKHGFVAVQEDSEEDEKDKSGAEEEFSDTFFDEKTDLGPTGKNPFFILEPGYQLYFEGKEEGKTAQLTIAVLDETKKVDGVETRIIEEREVLGKEIVEISRNFFAISKKTNNVYYFGEEVDIYKGGKVVDHHGAWMSGKDGARYGLFMPGTPLLGARFYNEVAPNVAMDRVEIESLKEKIDTKAGKFENCLKCEETTPLEKGNKEYKIYALGVGLAMDGGLKLVKYGKK